MKQLLKLTWTELKLQLREPLATFFTLIFPLMLLVVFGSIFGNEPEAFLGGFGQVDLSLPGYIGLIIGTVGLLSIPLTLANYREQGILRRYQATPLRPSTVLWAQVAVNVLMTALGIAILVVAGRLLFDLRPPTLTLAMVPAIALASFSFFAIGFMMAGVMPTPRSAQAVGMALLYPMLFLSGAAMPRQIMPETMQRIAEFLPLTHVVMLLEDLWFAGDWNTISLGVVCLMLVAGLVITRYTFRWE
ncbi:MAG: ABC transporter permease [Chloroflexota bacterium]